MKFPLRTLGLALAVSCALPAAAADIPITIQIGGQQTANAHPMFSAHDHDLITNYYAGRSSKLPPGLAKKKRLPPGLQKQLERNGHLPPGLEKRALPGDLERQLSPLPTGYSRVIVGRDVLIIQTSTQQILDILRNIVN